MHHISQNSKQFSKTVSNLYADCAKNSVSEMGDYWLLTGAPGMSGIKKEGGDSGGMVTSQRGLLLLLGCMPASHPCSCSYW